MYRVFLLAALTTSCGRHGFNSIPDSELAHVQVSPSWKVRELADLTNLVPYRPNDYQNGSDQSLGNAPTAVAALYEPFAGSLAVAAGRTIIELDGNEGSTLHDYRPAVPDTTGPDNIQTLAFGAPPDVGPALWIAAGSQTGGDGLYWVSSSWAITRDASNNNVRGVAFDATGVYDNIGVPTIYFVNDSHVNRRLGAGSSALLGGQDPTLATITLSATAVFVADNGPPGTIDRVFASTHARQVIATSTAFAVLEGGPLDTTTTTVIRDKATLAQYADDGTSQDLASSTDPDWLWVAGSAPQPPHPLAGGYVVLESNRTLDRDHLLYIAPR